MIKDIKTITPKQLVGALALGAAVGLVSGCARHWIDVATPAQAVELGFPKTVKLAEVQMYQDEFSRWAVNVSDTWDAREESAEETALFIDGVVGAVMNPENLASWGFNPYGGAGATFISLATMLTGSRRQRKEKEASYNAGLDKGKELSNG